MSNQQINTIKRTITPQEHFNAFDAVIMFFVKECGENPEAYMPSMKRFFPTAYAEIQRRKKAGMKSAEQVVPKQELPKTRIVVAPTPRQPVHKTHAYQMLKIHLERARQMYEQPKQSLGTR